MTSRDFCYWLQGAFEITGTQELNKEQIQVIKNHLNLVFYHEIDPSFGDDQDKQEEMNQIHQGTPLPSKLSGYNPNEVTLRC